MGKLLRLFIELNRTITEIVAVANFELYHALFPIDFEEK
jgi:hypothetical protein